MTEPSLTLPVTSGIVALRVEFAYERLEFVTMQFAHRRIAVLAASLLVTVDASCGSGRASESTAAATGSSVEGDVREGMVDLIVSDAADRGFQIDSDCIAGIVDQLSDGDFAQLASEVVDGDSPAELSPEGEALIDSAIECVIGSNDGPLIAQVVEKLLTEEGADVDEECLRTNVPKLTDEQLQVVLESEYGSAGQRSTDAQLENALLLLRDCIDLSSTDTS